ncbi:MAG: hypothetical protein EOO41_05115, partial [Methanobacteriota archaeon]
MERALQAAREAQVTAEARAAALQDSMVERLERAYTAQVQRTSPTAASATPGGVLSDGEAISVEGTHASLAQAATSPTAAYIMLQDASALQAMMSGGGSATRMRSVGSQRMAPTTPRGSAAAWNSTDVPGLSRALQVQLRSPNNLPVASVVHAMSPTAASGASPRTPLMRSSSTSSQMAQGRVELPSSPQSRGNTNAMPRSHSAARLSRAAMSFMGEMSAGGLGGGERVVVPVPAPAPPRRAVSRGASLRSPAGRNTPVARVASGSRTPTAQSVYRIASHPVMLAAAPAPIGSPAAAAAAAGKPVVNASSPRMVAAATRAPVQPASTATNSSTFVHPLQQATLRGAYLSPRAEPAGAVQRNDLVADIE